MARDLPVWSVSQAVPLIAPSRNFRDSFNLQPLHPHFNQHDLPATPSVPPNFRKIRIVGTTMPR